MWQALTKVRGPTWPNAFTDFRNRFLVWIIHYMHYNFGRIHKSLRVTSAMEAGIADQVWTLEEIAKLAD